MFWDKLIALCNAKHISPSKLCENLGLSNATATKWKNGSQPRDTAIIKICDYFGLPYDYFSNCDQQNSQMAAYGGSESKTIKLPQNITDDDLAIIKFIIDKYK